MDDKNEQNNSSVEVIDGETSVNPVSQVKSSMERVKAMSWVGKLSDNTADLDYIEKKLKALLDSDEVVGVDAVKVLKQLAEIDKEKTKRAMHLDMMLMKSMEIDSGKSDLPKLPINLVPQ